MARYVGDLTDLKNNEEREKAAKVVDEIAGAIRGRRVRHFSVDYHREVIPQTTRFGVVPGMNPWTVGVEIEKRGRHER